MRRILGYLDGRTVWFVNEPGAVARLASRGGLALGQVLTATRSTELRPVAETRLGPGVGLRGEALERARRKR